MTTDIAPLESEHGEHAADPAAGLGTLATSQGNLPLDAVDVRASIAGTSASVELTQGFRNPFDVPLEATYIFPLPDRAAVTAMRMEAAGHVVEGLLQERSQAREDYDQAIAEGRRAAIAEEDRPDVFTMRVGNIGPGERVTVRLTLAESLPYADGEVMFRFPLVVAPRYIPGSPLGGAPAGSGVSADTDAAPDASRISPPVLLPGFPNPVRLTISVGINPAGLPLTGIRCSLHATVEEADADGRTVVRLHPGERLDRDFILRLTVADPAQMATSLMLTPDPDDATQGTFTLTLLPPADRGLQRPRDVVLVLDRSGSMHGWKMVAARRAAARIVDTLTGPDRFGVLCFDGVVERSPDLPDGLADATDRNRFRAIEHLARTDARGGTEMLGPLEQAVRLLASAADPETAGDDAGRDRVLVLVTDGQVGNEDEILNRITPLLAGIRVHVVGIDRAVNAGFLSRLAGAGRGRCELVESEDRLDEAAARIHRRIGTPLVTALALAEDGLRIEPGTVAPGLLPDLFPGAPVMVTGRWRGHPGGSVIVAGIAADGARFESKVTATTGSNAAATANWARAHLRDLEDRYACVAGSDAAALARLEQQITDVSLRHGVLCRFTAFVAVDARIVTTGGAPHKVTQPVEFPAGWDQAHFGLRGAFPAGAGYMAAASAPPLPAPAPMAAMPGRGKTARARQVKASRAQPATQAAAAPSLAATEAADGTAGRLPQARSQVSAEVAELRRAHDAPDAERARFLADLATRLDALLTWLAGDPAAAGWLTEVAELAGKLRDCDKPGPARGAELNELWEEAIRVLAQFATQRPAFWKRST
ncbi:MAG: Vault protein inter-alpha-trypsin domain protein [Actinomycetia bacterium]|nr:Vault protein inter-alpha-trypsin domain protein [Actinomycetes bacterium]